MLLFNLGIRLAAAVLQVPPDVIGSRVPMMAPLPKSLEEMHRRQEMDEIMKEWDNELQGSHQSGPATYGEVTNVGARQLFDYMGIIDDPGSVFVDLGSGCGKLVLQAGLELQVPSFGVELDPERHEVALKHLSTIQNDTAEFVTLECDDLFEFDVSEATHVYVSSLCFTDEMMVRTSQKLFHEAPNLKCAATLKKLPSAQSWGEPRVEFIEMSWSKPLGCSVYFYDV